MKSLVPHIALFALLQAAPTTGEEASSTVLVVTSPELAEAWQAYADWKTRLGMPVRIITTERIGRNFDDAEIDVQEKIRRAIRHGIDKESVRWVLLGGDSQPDGGGHVPDRDTFHQNMWGEKADIPTDIFYLGESDWDADGDGIFGEHEHDREAISYPDGKVGIGRVPVRTAEDVAAYVAKVVEYESAYPGGAFARKMIYTCAVPSAEAKLKTSWKNVVSKAWPVGDGKMFWTGRSPWDERLSGDYDLSPSHLLELINRKEIGKFHFHGHGLPHCWILENDEEFHLGKLSELKNEGAYPVLTTVSCFTGQFDAEADPCITEALLRLPKAGLIAALAPSREGKPHFSDPQRDFPLMVREGKMDGTTETMTLFWKHGTGGGLAAGQAFARLKADLSPRAAEHENLHMCLCELNFLGDPTLPIHADAPKTVSASIPNTVSETMKIEGLPEGARVCVSDGRRIFGCATADANGIVEIVCELPPNPQPDRITVGIRADGHNALVRDAAVAKR